MKTKNPRAVRPNRSAPLKRATSRIPQLWCAFAGLFFFTGLAFGQDQLHPLEPLDRSSPRATLKTFLETGDAVGTLIVKDYMPSPSRATFHRLMALGEELVRCLDLNEVPPAARLKTGRAAALALYETLSRVKLPPFEQIPGALQPGQESGTNATFWTIPDTEITLVRVQNGSHRSEFLFSADTVARAEEFYQRVSGLPYTRPVPMENIKDLVTEGGGWMIPPAWVQALPFWLRAALAGQAVWKWIALVILLLIFALLVRLAYRLSKRGSSQHPFVQAVAQLELPVFILVTIPALVYLALVQLNLTGKVGSAVELTATAVMYLAGAWIAWRLAPVISEGIIASPKIAPESIDAHLIRICMRLLGIIAGSSLLVTGADRLGLPLYGIIAGLGVGGLAIALAAQPTIENLIGGLSLFADKSIRVGDVCRYGNDMGRVEAVGIRSTRIRGLDRTLTTIPNAALSRMPVVNLTQRDRTLLKTAIGVRYETTPEQLRCLLTQIREMLLSDPRVLPDPLRVRFVGFGPSSLDIEVGVHLTTRDWDEFIVIREELYLRIMDIVQASGTGFAFPSRTLYFTRDKGPASKRTDVAEG